MKYNINARQDDVVLVRKKMRIGDLLLEHKIITKEQLNEALAEQGKSGKKLGEILVGNGFVKEETFLEFLSRQLGIPRVDLKHHNFDLALLNLLPETHARHFRSIVLEKVGDVLLVGMVEPTDLFACDELSRILKRPIRTAIISESNLIQAIETHYRSTEDMSSIVEALGQEVKEGEGEATDSADASISSAPVVKLLRKLFDDAIHNNTSDIHVEPDQNVLRIRQRIDGILHEQIMSERKIALALISRLKLMSGLDISEKRLPQDGRFNIKLGSRSIDVRLSTMPTQFGESVVMRLLDQSKALLDLVHLGMPEIVLNPFQRLITRPNGMVLVTGPTGSGKTTTLYAALGILNCPEHKIIAVEDPIEYRMPRINQVQINTKIGLTFARVLRTALRQDPDIIMVGEMRDQETVEIGLRAAMTGHFVLSTLHTNDAISTVNRLVDMGAEGYLVATALRGVLAQRLVRRVCEKCSEPYEPDGHELAWLKTMLGGNVSDFHLKHGKGCPQCNKTGYRGRLGVYELLEIDDPLAEALRMNDTSEFTNRARSQKKFRTFTMCALDYAMQGITTLDEVLRISDGLES